MFATVTGLVAATALALATAGAAQAVGSTLVSDTFTHNTVSSSNYVVGGQIKDSTTMVVSPHTPCLTVPGGTSGTPTSCAGATDADGQGALRLTDNSNNETGYILYNHALPTKGGLDVSFTQYQWGGASGYEADGISFFLTDGQYDLTQPGPLGGSLGYNAKSAAANNGTALPGLAHALLGVGLDEYGNFAVETNDFTPSGTCTAPAGYSSTKYVGGEITVRGPAGDVAASGGSTSGYCLLANPTIVSGMAVAAPTAPAVATRPTQGNPGDAQVRITVDPPSNVGAQVKVYWNGTLATSIDEPAQFATTGTFKFGFAASTGGKTDYHEISQLTVSTINAIDPGLTISSPASMPAVPAHATSTVPVSVALDPADGPLTSSTVITTTIHLSSGSFAATPTGTRWSCPTPAAGALTLVCSYTPDPTVDIPGATLPVLNVPVTNSTAGTVNATFTLSATPNSTTTNQTSTTAVPFTLPTIAPIPTAALTAVPVGATPPTATATAVASGTGPFTYAITTTPPSSSGTATINPSTGALTFTPVAGFSGTVTIPVSATDAYGNTVSTTWTVNVVPTVSATGGRHVAGVGITQTITPAAPVGVGPFTYHLASTPAASKGTVTINPTSGAIRFVPRGSFVGEVSAEYFVVDASGLQSTPVTVTFRVVGSLATTGVDVAGTFDGSLLALAGGSLLVAVAAFRRRRQG